MIVALAAVVMHVRGQKMARHGLDRLAEIAHQVGMTVIETDTDVDAVEFILNEVHQRLGFRERIRNHFERDMDVLAARFLKEFLDGSPRQLRLVVVRRDALRGWRAEVDDEMAIGNMSGQDDGGLSLLQGGLPAGLIARGVRERVNPLSPLHGSNDRRVYRVKLETRIGKPFGEFRDRPLVVIVEVCAGGEELDGLEAVRGDVDEMLTAQRLLVKQMCRDAEAIHRRCLSEAPPDARRVVLVTGQISDRAPYCRARSLRSAVCTGCKRDCRG